MMKLIVGLGNPGTEYEHSRHNAGFLAIDAFAASYDAQWTNAQKQHAQIAKIIHDGKTIILAKPQTFMNLSGQAVQALASYYKVETQDILIIQDELDLPPGRIAFIHTAGDAGHNGIASIQEMLKTKDLARLRIGIGRPTPPIQTEDWVLGEIEKESLDNIQTTPKAIQDWIQHGLLQAMNQWNRAA